MREAVERAALVLIPGSPLTHPDHAWLNRLASERLTPSVVRPVRRAAVHIPHEEASPFEPVDVGIRARARQVARTAGVPISAPAPRNAVEPCGAEHYACRSSDERVELPAGCVDLRL